MFRANYPVDNPSDYWKIPLYTLSSWPETLDHLVEEISKRVVSKEDRFGVGVGDGAYNLNPTSLLNLTPEIIDRLFNVYQRYLPRKVDFVDEVERWKIRWALVDDK